MAEAANNQAELARLELARLRGIVLEAYPELAASRFTLSSAGWDSVALDVDDRLIFRFPRRPDVETSLRREAAILARVRRATSVRVPDLHLHEAPCTFTVHEKIPGGHLLAAEYNLLKNGARRRLAAELAILFAELHQLDPREMQALGAPVWPGWPAQQHLEQALPILPAHLHGWAKQATKDWLALPPDPHGQTFGFFDAHGWNMAFDHDAQKLNGVYDFGDARIAGVHHEFMHICITSADLARLTAVEYAFLTGRVIDLRRVDLGVSVLLLGELQAAHPDENGPGDARLPAVADWAAGGIAPDLRTAA